MKFFARAAIAASLMAATSTGCLAADTFSGLYGGIESAIDAKEGTVFAGGLAGYRFRVLGPLVVGVEVNYGDHVTGTYEAEQSIRHFKGEWGASALAGLAFGEGQQNLLYGTIGYMDVDFDTVTQVGSTESADDLRFGAGFERKLGDMLSLRVGADYAKPAGSEMLRGKVALLVNF
ncbi:MAG: hypothetical protein EP335_05385 [Alphaproteobacteria bacterium]|nr:MAG: hypothetical protein EP335_05385 [Alphaproteobacteria bacterium]